MTTLAVGEVVGESCTCPKPSTGEATAAGDSNPASQKVALERLLAPAPVETGEQDQGSISWRNLSSGTRNEGYLIPRQAGRRRGRGGLRLRVSCCSCNHEWYSLHSPTMSWHCAMMIVFLRENNNNLAK